MPLYVADWLSSQSIAVMTAEEERGYLRLLMHSWLAGDCCLPDDDDQLAALSLLGEKWHQGSGAKIRRSFKRKQVRGEAKLFNEKLASLWKERRDYVEQCRQAGIRSGEARRSGTNGRSTDVPTDVPTKRQRKGNSSSSSSSASSSSKSIIDVWLGKVTAETIADTGLLLEWLRGAVAAGAFDGSDFHRDRIAALALRCRARGKNPPGLFVKLIREGAYHHANADEFEAAVAAVREHLNAAAGPSDPEIAALLANFGKIPEGGANCG